MSDLKPRKVRMCWSACLRKTLGCHQGFGRESVDRERPERTSTAYSPLGKLSVTQDPGETTDHQLNHRQLDERFAASRRRLVVLAQPTPTPQPRDRPLDSPAEWYHLELRGPRTLRLDLQAELVAGPKLPGPLGDPAVVDRFVHDRSQTGEAVLQRPQHELRPVAVLDADGVNDDREDQAQAVDEDVPFAAVDLLARVVAARPFFPSS
jgi:hypothetical protein